MCVVREWYDSTNNNNYQLITRRNDTEIPSRMFVFYFENLGPIKLLKIKN
jgi:hypothetical protein